MLKKASKLVVSLFLAAVLVSSLAINVMAADETVSINKAIEDKANWKGTIIKADGNVVSGGNAAEAIFGYKGDKFHNKVLDFNIKTSKLGESKKQAVFVGMTARSTNISGSFWNPTGSGYLLLIFNDGYELQKWVKGTQNYLERKEGVVTLKEGVESRVQWGAIDVDGGVKLTLTVDGKKIFDIVDKGEIGGDALTKEGHFQVWTWNIETALAKVSDKVKEEPKAEKTADTADANPKTGDAGTMIYILMAGIGAAGAGITVFKKRMK